jgi:hypothetical protein
VVVGDLLCFYQQYLGYPDKKNNKENLELNDTTDLMYLTDVYRILHPATAQYIFFSAAHGTFKLVYYLKETAFSFLYFFMLFWSLFH